MATDRGHLGIKSKLTAIFSGDSVVTHNLSSSSDDDLYGSDSIVSGSNTSHAIDSNKSLALAFYTRRLMLGAFRIIQNFRTEKQQQ
jgi:hypothetical protein